MSNEETSYEQNLRRLVQASCGAETRVTPSARRQLRQRLLAECRTHSVGAEFPVTVLGVLTCVLLLPVVGGVLAVLGRRSLAVDSAILSPFGAIVLVNLLCLPIAGIVIVVCRRRRSCLSV